MQRQRRAAVRDEEPHADAGVQPLPCAAPRPGRRRNEPSRPDDRARRHRDVRVRRVPVHRHGADRGGSRRTRGHGHRLVPHRPDLGRREPERWSLGRRLLQSDRRCDLDAERRRREIRGTAIRSDARHARRPRFDLRRRRNGVAARQFHTAAHPPVEPHGEPQRRQRHRLLRAVRGFRRVVGRPHDSRLGERGVPHRDRPQLGRHAPHHADDGRRPSGRHRDPRGGSERQRRRPAHPHPQRDVAFAPHPVRGRRVRLFEHQQRGRVRPLRRRDGQRDDRRSRSRHPTRSSSRSRRPGERAAST